MINERTKEEVLVLDRHGGEEETGRDGSDCGISEKLFWLEERGFCDL